MWLPDRVFLRPLMLRAAVVWLSTRLGLAIIIWLREGMGEPFSLRLTLPAAGWVVLAVAGLNLLEARRRGEDVLLANLGTPARTLFLLSGVPPALAELLVASVSSAGG
ncbi:MAG TPA: hypothetical protein VFY20_09135 [Gemmatimonadales bacterium]|nr:hypothetical protein [Gemmatimonadales bacterium]